MKPNVWMLFWNKYWNFIASTIVFVLVIFGLWVRHGRENITGQSIRDSCIAFLITLLITFTFRLSVFQLALENNQDIVSKFLHLLTKNSSIAKIIEYSFEAQKNKNHFYGFFLAEVLEEYNRQLQSISQGKYICDPESELTVTKTILQCCNKCLKAVSFEDEKWWNSNNGVLYLDAHSKHIDRSKEKATRIFIIKSTDCIALQDVFRRHQELEIEIYIIYTDSNVIENKYKIDFVIYDDFMLRRAYEIRNFEGGKNALFTSEENEVKEYLNLFDQLLIIAKKLNNPIPLGK